MVKNSNWLSALKKALTPKKSKSKKKDKNFDAVAPVPPPYQVATSSAPPASPPPLPLLPLIAQSPVEDVTFIKDENEPNNHANQVAVATSEAAVEDAWLTLSGKSREEIAATKIQTAFRGYLARRAFRGLRGLARLKALIQGQSVKRQASNTLRAMQTIARVQSQVRTRRLRMSEENQALQLQLLQNRHKLLQKSRASSGEQWDDSSQSKEQIEAKLMHKQEAAMRRERALAYAFSHQQAWKNSSKAQISTFTNPSNPQWGWSWLERWMADRPWEGNDPISAKGTTTPANVNKPPSSSQRASHQGPPAKAPSPRRGVRGAHEDSGQPKGYRRHSIGGFSVRDEQSLGSSPSVSKPKSRVPSQSGVATPSNGKRDRAISGKKQLSAPASQARSRRHLGPPVMDSGVDMHTRNNVFDRESNGM